ncbi:MAG: MFS transporter [Pseudomonadota bacterium]
MNVETLPRRKALLVIAICVAIFAVGQFHRASGAVFAPILADRFALTATLTGALVSAMFFATILFQAPFGAALDRFGLRPVVSLSLISIALGTAVFAISSTYGQAVAGRAIIGVGSACMGAATHVIVARAFPARDFGYVNGLVVGLGGIGGLIGTYPLALALENAPFAAVFAVAAALILCLAAATLSIFAGERFRKPTRSEVVASLGFLDLLRLAEFRRILILGAVTFAPIVTVTGVWGGPYLRDVHGMTAEGAGALLLLWYLATASGGLAYGWIERRGWRRRRVIGISLICSIACFAALAAIPSSSSAVPAMVMCLMVFSQQFYIPLGAHMRRVAPPASLGRASTLLMLVSVGGIPLMQTGFGAILDAAAAAGLGAEDGYRLGFAAIAALIALCGLIYRGALEVDGE